MAKMTPEQIKVVMKSATQWISEAEINQLFDQLAETMRQELEDQNPLLLCVMNGGLMTTSELMKRLQFPLQQDYIHATRYSGETTGGSSVHWRSEPSMSLEDRVVVIVDDILDGGLTLTALIEYCEAKKAKKIYTAVMLDKVEGRTAGALQKADFTGLEIENKYVFGFGLDYHDYLRNVPAIYAVADEHMV